MTDTPPRRAAELAHSAPPRVFGRDTRILEQVDSTNAEVLRRAAAGAGEGAVIVAATQSAGRGRSGRRWLDRPGDSLLCSVLLRPRLAPEHIGLLSPAIAVGVATALREIAGADVRLKWPNDVVVQASPSTYLKLVGILVEGGGDTYVAGIGVNVNGVAGDFPADVRDAIATLEMIDGHRREPEDVLRPILAHCEEAYFLLLRGGAADIIARFAALDICLGRRVTVLRPEGSLTGTARAIAPDGGLVIEHQTGHTEVVYAGDVSVRPA